MTPFEQFLSTSRVDGTCLCQAILSTCDAVVSEGIGGLVPSSMQGAATHAAFAEKLIGTASEKFEQAALLWEEQRQQRALEAREQMES